MLAPADPSDSRFFVSRSSDYLDAKTGHFIPAGEFLSTAGLLGRQLSAGGVEPIRAGPHASHSEAASGAKKKFPTSGIF
jgi:hypothetical protein